MRVAGALHALDLPAAVAPAVAALWEGRPLDSAAGSAVDDALRAAGARIFDGGAPARVDLVLPSAIVAGAPWEALVPRGVPVVRRAPGAVAHTRPARPPLRAAVAPDATLPDAILAAVFGTRDYTPLLVLRPWPSPRAEVVQLRALPELGEVATLYAALTSAGAQLLLVEAYAYGARVAARGVAWALVAAGVPEVVVIEDPGVLPELWADLVQGRPLVDRLFRSDWTFGTCAAGCDALPWVRRFTA